ncbi:MAG: DUF2339 domain-containing protein, partial [Aridibacter famidurans]|nr:DUF2339 domain-containing protein [Aridibacter famidurans]
MANQEERIERLRNRLEELVRRHGEFAGEIVQIRREIAELRDSIAPEPSASEAPLPKADAHTAHESPETAASRPETSAPEISGPTFEYEPAETARSFPVRTANLEEWVGGNLISKIGIAITILGVAIGAKYAIDRGWITPVMRIVFGYIVGAGLLFFAIRLRERYERFSAVLLSGAMAIFYFISYAAYDYYSLIPQALAFALMALFTVFTVFAAIRYERVVIAHIGLVGAYAVPFLLSEESGRVAFLFGYMSVINAGILAVSVARYWRSLFYSSFLLTWTIFLVWFQFRYYPEEHFSLALVFSFLFFGIFYATFIVYKLLEGKQFAFENAALVIANAFVYYGFLYAIVDDHEVLSNALGLITAGNASLHLGVAFAVHRYAAADRSVISLLVG